MAEAGGEERWRPKANPWLIAVVVTLAAFMEILDTTIVNVSLPYIAGDLASSYDDSTWALTSYLAANGIVLTVSGWFARALGRKRYFMICIGMFTVFSFLCGVATSLPELIVFRLMQGFFGGGLQPNQQSIILDTFPPARRGAAFALTAVATIIAPVLGPTLGGYLTFDYNWRWVFFINVPIGVLTLFAVGALVEDPPWSRKEATKLDYVGLGLITLGLGCLEVMVDRGEDDDWFGSGFIRLMGLGALVGIVGAIGWLLVASRPIVNLRVLRDRNFAVSTVLIGMLGAILYSSAVVIPQLVQNVLDYNAVLAGLVLSPGALLILALIPLVNWLLGIVQLRYLIAVGFTISGCALVLSGQLFPQIDFKTLMFIRLGQTAGLAFLFVPISTIAFATVPRRLNGDAAALFSMSRNVLGAVSISLANSQITERTQIREAYLGHWATPFRQAYNHLLSSYEQVYRAYGTASALVSQAARNRAHQMFILQAQVLAYNDLFGIVAVMAFLVVPFCFLLGPVKASDAGGRGGH